MTDTELLRRCAIHFELLFNADVPIIVDLRARLEQPEETQGKCAECGKKSSDGYALYCVKCLEPKQEPVAIVQQEAFGRGQVLWIKPHLDVLDGTSLYTAPPQREWVGLTDDEIKILATQGRTDFAKPAWEEYALAIEAKLKEKNNGR